ncbi:MAG TPA: hypothetical protein VKP61_04925 [Candidatus Acidoferrum sp.]|nr:hypothetical protein [Candidatus Acidoferrum sp.]
MFAPGVDYSLETVPGETSTRRVEFVRDSRGVCFTVHVLNDALLWVAVKGVRGSIEVQAWLSAFSFPPSQLEAFDKKWEQRLREIFQE